MNTATTSTQKEYAAIDLGSNSFHMVVAVENDHAISVIDRMREMVRLASGLNEKNEISDEAQERALACLSRFGERLRGLDENHVRVVGTNTLRKAKNAAGFLARAEQALGFPIDIISGVEEARLIHQGVSQNLQEDLGRRLVIDIGGGSTELIVGGREKIDFLESLYMGCVSYTQRFFKKGKLSRDRLRKAIVAAQLELEPHRKKIKKLGWQDAIGSSGTARAIARVVQANGWSEVGISIAALEQLLQTLMAVEHVDKLKLDGLGDERRPVFVGGVAVMLAVFRSLKIKHMRISGGSLREGVLDELVGRNYQRDTREQAVADLMKRHHVDEAQAMRVQNTAYEFFRMSNNDWKLNVRDGQLLSWAAQLHEVGLSLAHSQYHKHGAYMLQHMDLPGFSRQEQNSLALLVRLHRRKFDVSVLQQCANTRKQVLLHLAVLLRLSVLLNRSRSEDELVLARLSVAGARVKLELPGDWLAGHPLTQADLERETEDLQRGEMELKIIASK